MLGFSQIVRHSVVWWLEFWTKIWHTRFKSIFCHEASWSTLDQSAQLAALNGGNMARNAACFPPTYSAMSLGDESWSYSAEAGEERGSAPMCSHWSHAVAAHVGWELKGATSVK